MKALLLSCEPSQISPGDKTTLLIFVVRCLQKAPRGPLMRKQYSLKHISILLPTIQLQLPQLDKIALDRNLIVDAHDSSQKSNNLNK